VENSEGGSGLTAAHVHITWTAVTNIFADVSPSWLNGGGVEQEGCLRDGVSKSHWNAALVSQRNNAKLAPCIMEKFGTNTKRDWMFCFRSTNCLWMKMLCASIGSTTPGPRKEKYIFGATLSTKSRNMPSTREWTPCCYKACPISATKHAPDVRKHWSMLNAVRHL
jgi:hypothetical protein